MARIHAVPEDRAPSHVKEIYSAIEKKMGKVPNIFLNMGNSAAVLNGYLTLSDAADKTTLPPKLREQIALVVGQTNECNYCLSAHTAIAQSLGISNQDIILSRKAEVSDPKELSILTFAKSVVQKRGNVTDQEIETLKEVGVSDQELVEIMLIITLNMFTNYFNHVTGTPIDFPLAPALK